MNAPDFRNWRDLSPDEQAHCRRETHERGRHLLTLDDKHGFDSVLELMSILHDLSISRHMRMLSDASLVFGHLNI